MKRRGAAWHGMQVVVTCEHACNAVPAALGGLGLTRAVLASHRGWDPGALGIARAVAKALGAPLHAGRWSRLVADLNRSEDHPEVVARRVDGRPVPGNAGRTEAGLEARLRRYWRPWRAAAAAAIRGRAAASGVVHLSVHSFVPELRGVVRQNDIGLLCDPARPREVAFCRELKRPLAAAGFSVRRNAPYFGDTDGFTSHLRAELPPHRYLGIELECNQRDVAARSGERRYAAALCAALLAVLRP